jgi:hypothetical protein
MALLSGGRLKIGSPHGNAGSNIGSVRSRSDLCRRIYRACRRPQPSTQSVSDPQSRGSAQRGRSDGAARGRTRWCRCGSPLPPCYCALLARRSSGGASRSRVGPGNKSESGRCTRSARRGADLLGATERRARGAQNLRPAGPPRAIPGVSVGPDRGGSLLLPRIRGRD